MPGKIDDYRKYWAKVLEPDYQDFQATNDDLRKAFHCAGSLFHMADWLYWGKRAYIDATFAFKDKTGTHSALLMKNLLRMLYAIYAPISS
jgi:hypothetical protein